MDINNRFKTQIATAVMALSLTTLAGCAPKSPEEQLEQAQQYIAKNDYKSAIIELKGLITKNPDNIEARKTLADTYFKTGFLLNANKEYRRVYEQQPSVNNSFKLSYLSSLFLSSSFEDIILLSDDKFLEGCADCKVIEILALKESADDATAMDTLTSVSKPLDSNLTKPVLEAYIYNDVEGLQKELSKLPSTAYDSTSTVWQYIYANLFFKAKDYNNAKALYKKVLDAVPRVVYAQLYLAQSYISLNEYPEAEQQIDAVLSVRKSQPTGNYLKSVIEFNKGDMEKAIRFSKSALDSGLDIPPNRLILGIAQFRMEKYEEALVNLRNAAKDFPKNHQVHDILMETRLRLGDIQGVGQSLIAQNDYSEADIPLLNKAIASVLKSQGNNEQVRKLAGILDSIETTEESLNSSRALTQLYLGDDKNIEIIQNLIDKDPTNQQAQIALINFYLKNSEINKATGAIKKWKAQEPQNALPYNLMATIFYSQKNFTEARNEFNQVKALSPESPAPEMFEAQMALSEERNSDALSHLENVLKTNPGHFRALSLHLMLTTTTKYKIDKSLALINEAIAAGFENDGYLLLKSTALVSLNKLEEAEKALNTINTNYKNEKYWQLKFLVKARNSTVSELHQLLKNWQIAIPNSLNAYLYDASLYASRDKYDDAVAVTQKALTIHPAHKALALLEIQYLTQAHNVKAAWQKISALSEDAKQTDLYLLVLGKYYLETQDYKLAQQYFEQHYQKTSSLESAYYISRLIPKDNTKESKAQALQFLQQHLDKFPNDTRCRMLLAESYMVSGDDRAAKQYELYLQQQPDNYIALNNLAWILFQNGEVDRALGYVKKAYEINPDAPSIVSTYLRVLHSLKKDKDGLLVLNDFKQKHEMTDSLLELEKIITK